MREGDLVDSFIIVVSGIVQVYTEFEGNEFVIENLHSGSILNHRQIFMGAKMHVNLRSSNNARILTLSQQKIAKIMEEDEKFKNEMQLINNLLVSKGKQYPLDYILQIPPIMLDKRISQIHHK